MLLSIVTLTATAAFIVTLCAKDKTSRNPSSVTPKRPIRPIIPTAKESTLIQSVTPPDSPQRSLHTAPAFDSPTNPADAVAVIQPKGASPVGGSANNTVRRSASFPGTEPTATGTTVPSAGNTPQSSLKKREQSNRSVPEKTCSYESQDLLIETFTEGPDSLMEKGHTTKTKEPTCSNYQQPSRKKRAKTKRKTHEKTAKTMQSPMKKTEKEKEKEKKEPMTSSSGNCESQVTAAEVDEEIKEKTSKDQTDEKEKKNLPKDLKDEKKTMENKRTVEPKIPPAIIPIDSTQHSNTRKERNRSR